ncbi:DUF6894 family protein [Methylobacterium komagatae]|uniref:DUF6894 family protein n=1 Tax=Methylobacterium komagatae TaxID=374425 RepID=A0ABW2BRN6_9HYPH
MPRYHFNVFDGYSGSDEEGCEFPDWSSARLAAIKLAGEILREDPYRILACPDWRIEVTDQTGLVLIRLDFCAVESPVVTHAALA